MYTLVVTHTEMRSSAQKCIRLEIKGLRCERLLLCTLTYFKKIDVIVASHNIRDDPDEGQLLIT